MDWPELVRLTKKYNLTWSEEFGDDIWFVLYEDFGDEIVLGTFLELEDMLEFLQLKEKIDESV